MLCLLLKNPGNFFLHMTTGEVLARRIVNGMYHQVVSVDFNCQSIVNPIADVSKFLPSAGNNYANFEDAKLESLYDELLKAGTPEEQTPLLRAYEKRVLNDLSSQLVTLWWYKINPHRSYVKGWKIAPSHYLNQSLDNIWIDAAEKKSQGVN